MAANINYTIFLRQCKAFCGNVYWKALFVDFVTISIFFCLRISLYKNFCMIQFIIIVYLPFVIDL